MKHLRGLALSLLLTSLSTAAAFAATPPCQPCAGIRVEDPAIASAALTTGLKVEGDARLYVQWSAKLDGSASNAGFEQIRQAGGTPWLAVAFRAPSPVLEHLDDLKIELEALASLAQDAGERAHFQLSWQPSAGDWNAKDFAFIFKRAAVAVTGAQPDGRVLAGSLAPYPGQLRTFYGEDVAAYVDGIALQPEPAGNLEAAIAVLRELDPGKPIALDHRDWPTDPASTLALTAEASQLGFAVTFFDFTADRAAADLAPLKLLAREFQGDMSFDPYTLPTGAKRAWTFVKGEDLSLRVIAEAEPDAAQMTLMFEDSQLRSPRLFDLADGFDATIFGQRRSTNGLVVPLEQPAKVSVLKIERMSAAELEGLDDTVLVDDQRQMPVEEVLRQLQAFEDDQARKLLSYQASNILHLRFNVGGTGGVEASFEGDFFYRQGGGFDWAWQEFYFNGVKWKGEKLPEIPLLQPEKAAVLPLEINFTKEYTYRLRGTDVVDGRDCWVVDFEPLANADEGNLYQGTVWVDRQIYARVKTRTLQLGLEGEVLSNEETVFFTPVDDAGQAAAWDRSSYFLPTRVVGQQVWSLLNSATQVEREAVLSNIRINSDNFDQRLAELHDSEVTMVRDTPQGLRYLVKGESGEREVKEGFDTKRLFLAGGVFYDEGQDFPIPLAGINYLDLNFRDSGGQLNIFFAGAFVTANIAQPRLFGSRWDVGANVNGFFISLGDELYRDGREVAAEEVEQRRFAASLFAGRFLGNYTKLDFTYGLTNVAFSDADDTAEDFILPQDTLEQSLQTELTYARNGYRLQASGSTNSRSDWEFWGLPDNTDFDPQQDEFVKWQVSVAKTFWLKRFTKFSIELEHLNGSDLDRFSKYDFGIFGDASVAGYQGGLVRAAEADGIHLSYGFDLGSVLQVELEGDAVWATDETTGLDRELLGGMGVEGTVIGPWNTIVNFEVGVPVAGPGDGFSARIVFLKLFG